MLISIEWTVVRCHHQVLKQQCCILIINVIEFKGESEFGAKISQEIQNEEDAMSIASSDVSLLDDGTLWYWNFELWFMIHNYVGESILDENNFNDLSSGDFYPFDSKEAALLYILINSPMPVVRTTFLMP